MKQTMSRVFLSAVALSAAVARSVEAPAATIAAMYEFNNTLAADESGAPALVATDPLGQNAFHTDTVLGQSRVVYAFNGNNSPPSQQAGVTVNTTGLVPPEDYSVDTVLEFTQNPNTWRRLIDVQNRQSDDGFYVNPSNDLAIYPVVGSTASWTNNAYHHIVLTNNGAQVAVYLDGISQFTASTTVMNLDGDPTNNPNKLMGFFLDNVVGGGQGEFSSGNVALIRLWDGVLTPSEAQQLALNPFVPEPSTALLLTAGVLGLAAMRRRQRFNA